MFCERGYHSVLAVAYKRGRPRKSWTDKLFMANWRKGRADWVSWGEILTCAELRRTPRLIAPLRMIQMYEAAKVNFPGKPSDDGP